MSKSHLVYFSATGTGKQIGKCVADSLFQGDEFEILDLTFEQCDKRYTAADIVIVVAPVYAGRVAPLALEKFAGLRGNGARAVLVLVYGNRHYEDAIVELIDFVTDLGFVPFIATACIGEHSYSTADQQIGANRPDEQDLLKISNYFKTIISTIENGDSVTSVVPGNRPYKDGIPTFFPMHPEHVADECTLCGLCISKCPLVSISIKDDAYIQEEACLMCCACIKACPQGALSFSSGRVAETRDRLFEMCKERREPEFYICGSN